jgi:hypothetical protein
MKYADTKDNGEYASSGQAGMLDIILSLNGSATISLASAAIPRASQYSVKAAGGARSQIRRLYR